MNSEWNQLAAQAWQQIETRDFAAAAKSIGRALLSAPEEKLARLYAVRAFIHAQLGNFDGSLVDCDISLKSDLDCQALVWRANCYAAREDWQRATWDVVRATQFPWASSYIPASLLKTYASNGLVQLASIMNVNSASPELFRARGFLYEALGDFARSRRDFELSYEQAPQNMETRLALAESYLRSGERDKARELLSLTVADKLATAKFHMTRAKVLDAFGHRRTALLEVDYAIERSTFPSEDFYEVADTVRTLQFFSRAIDLYGQHLHRAPDSIWALMGRASSFIGLRSLRLAEQDLSAAINTGCAPLSVVLMRGETRSKLRDFRGAREDLERCMEIDDTQPEIYWALAELSAAENKAAESHSNLTKALRLFPNFVGGKLVTANQQLQKKNFSQAASQYEEVLNSGLSKSRDQDRLADSWYGYGIALLELRRNEEALAAFDQAASIRRNHAGTYIWRFRTNLELGRYRQAITDWELAAALSPVFHKGYADLVSQLTKERFAKKANNGSVEEQNLRACFYAYFQQNLPEFQRISTELLQKDLTKFTSNQKLDVVFILLKGENFGAARVLLDEIPTTQRDVDWYTLNASARYSINDLSQSVSAIEEAIVHSPDDPQLYQLLGDVHRTRRSIRKSIENYSIAIDIGPDTPALLRTRGLAHFDRDENNRALLDLSVSLDIYPDQPQTISARGHVFLQEKKIDRALHDFDVALTRNPQVVSAYCGRGIILAQREEYEAAIIWLTKALHRFTDPIDWSEIIGTRAKLFFNMRRYERAIEDWTAVAGWIHSNNDLAKVHFSRGISYFHANDVAACRSDLNEVLRLRPDHKSAREVLDWLDNRSTRLPKSVVTPKQQVRPTRPSIQYEKWIIDSTDFAADPIFPHNQWIIKLEDGMEFGPISRNLLFKWCEQGRIAEDTWVLRSDWSKWRRAKASFRNLEKKKSESTTSSEVDLQLSIGGQDIMPSWSMNETSPETDSASFDVSPDKPRRFL